MRHVISIGISLGVFIVFAIIVEAGRRRGLDPVGSAARMLSPEPDPVDPAV